MFFIRTQGMVKRYQHGKEKTMRQTKTNDVREAIRRDFVISGNYYNQLLPAEQTLAERFGVSIITVRRAVEALVHEGLLEKRQGSRTAVVMPESVVSRRIGVMIPERQISSFYFKMGAQIANLLRCRGHQVQIFAGKDTDSRELLQFQNNSGTRLDGVIVCGYLANHRLIREQRLPYVLAGGEGWGEMDGVSFDLRSGAVKAVNCLLELGHRRIMFVSNYFEDGPHIESLRDNFLFAETARFAGYCEALRNARLQVQPELIVHGGSGKRSAYLAINRRWKSDRLGGATAIFASTDLLAEGIMQALTEHGVRIPEDISIFGCDNQLDPKDSLFPPLSTLDLRYDEVAARAVDIMLRKLDSPPEEEDMYICYYLIPKLLIRSTVAGINDSINQ